MTRMVPWIGAAALAGVSLIARAQTDSASESHSAPAPPPKREVQASFSLLAEEQFPANFKDAPGDVTAARVRGTLGVNIPTGDVSTLSVSWATESDFYRFTGASGFAPGFNKPWDSVLDHTLTVRFAQKNGLQVSWFVGGEVESAGEVGASFSDTLTFTGYAGFMYWTSEHFGIGLAGGAQTRLERSVLAYPLPSFYWEFADRWALRTDFDRGQGLTLSYHPSEEVGLTLGAKYRPRMFRLDDQGADPGGVGREYQIPVRLGVDWNLSKQVTLSAGAGVNVWQRYDLLDSNGNSLAQFKTDPAVVLDIGVLFRF